jgi:hypothetical protein
MSHETLNGHNSLGWWLDQTPPQQIHKAVDQLWTWGTHKPNPADRPNYANAGWAMSNAPALDALYGGIYPDATYAHDRLRILSLDLQTMVDHDELLCEMDGEGTFTRLLESKLDKLLNGAEYTAELNLESFVPLDKIAGSPSGLRRLQQGMSPELKALAARVRLNYPPAHLHEDRWPHDIMWWRERVVQTLGLTPQDLEMTRRLGVVLENAAPDYL